MTQPRRRAPRSLATGVTAATLSAALLLTGCGSAGDAADSTEPEPASAAGDPESEPDDAEAGETPSVQPATGPRIRPKTGGISVRIPQGWKVGKNYTLQIDAVAPGHRGMILVDSFPTFHGESSSRTDIQQLARSALRINGYKHGVVRPPILLRGVRMYHITDRPQNPIEQEFGAILSGDLLTVTFDLHRFPPKQRQEIIDSVLATLRWN